MAWYRTGTVTVTDGSTTVTGAGTAFVANVIEGEGFLGSDGKVYEIAAVVSATELTLAVAYTGATAAGQAYAILPTQSALADLAVEAAELVNSFAAVRDGAGEGLFGDGTAATPGVSFAADQDTGLWRPGANAIAVVTSGAERMRLTSTGLGIGNSAPAEKLDITGQLQVGEGASTNGVTAMQLRYSGLDRLVNIGSLRSTSGLAFGFAVKPSTVANEAWVSSANNVNWKRAGIVLDGDKFSISFAAAQSAAIGSAVALSEKFRVGTDGKVGIGTASPANTLTVAGIISPSADNVHSFGTASLRASTVYAGTGTINTSDERGKAWRGPLTDDEYRAGLRVIQGLGFYQWNDAVAEKGVNGARYHFGVRAQAIWEIFADEGLVDPIDLEGRPGATPYGFLCWDEWSEETRSVLDEAGEPTGENDLVLEGGDRYGIRPDELALFLVAVQARRQAELEARLTALETSAS